MAVRLQSNSFILTALTFKGYKKLESLSLKLTIGISLCESYSWNVFSQNWKHQTTNIFNSLQHCLQYQSSIGSSGEIVKGRKTIQHIFNTGNCIAFNRFLHRNLLHERWQGLLLKTNQMLFHGHFSSIVYYYQISHLLLPHFAVINHWKELSGRCLLLKLNRAHKLRNMPSLP